MKLTIIIPVYNIKEYIERCVSSLGNISATQIEILIIDDGSYENKAVEIVAYLDLRGKTAQEKKTAINGIKTWLIGPKGYKTLVFDDTIEYKAICKGVEISEVFNDYLEVSIEFEAAEVFS